MSNKKEFRQCTRCIMDTTDPDIVFDSKGVCNHCYKFDEIQKTRMFDSDEQRDQQKEVLLEKIKAGGKGKPYDCIIGVSGGVDSTYVAYLVKEVFGLRPLAVHFDNGWNSELAVKNIENILEKMDIDLFTYVVNWEEFKDLQLSFLKASTPDGEVPTDHAIIAVLYNLAVKHGIKYILNGVNYASEAIMPLKWGYGYYDSKYIGAVQKEFGTKKLKSYPRLNLAKLGYYSKVKKIQFVPILNYVDYFKEDAMNLIQNKLGWKYYGGKHYESIYTRFFQSYILPQKFEIDKRKAHFSNLVLSGQITKSEALEELKKPVYPADLMKDDKEYAIKKFNISAEEFERIMELPTKTFQEYPNNFDTLEKIKKI